MRTKASRAMINIILDLVQLININSIIISNHILVSIGVPESEGTEKKKIHMAMCLSK